MAKLRKASIVSAVHADRPTLSKNFNTRGTREERTRVSRLLDQAEYVPIERLKAYGHNARKHPKRQLRKLEKGIREFGFVVPALVDGDNVIIAGHARVEAATNVGLTEVPIVRVTHLSRAQVRALRIADNRLAELAEWDAETLAIEFQSLVDIDFDVELTGFEVPEIDLLIDEQLVGVASGTADEVPPLDDAHLPVTRPDDLWHLDEHRLYCGDARDRSSYEAALDGRPAQMIFTDPPYNVSIRGNVCGSGEIDHPEFIMASGEMTEQEFAAFLAASVRNLVRFSIDGSVHFIFMDWRNLGALERVCRRYYAQQLNLCAWVKTNGGMGSLYRSQHELVGVFKNGAASHINNVRLGKYGRNRTNVWVYEGVNTVNPERRRELALHPTVKPVALVADAIRDCSKRKGIILDPFVGSGTTIIAAEETGRICCALELDPRYVDVAVRRWQAFTSGNARHAESGLTFAEMETIRHAKTPLLPPPTTTRSEEA